MRWVTVVFKQTGCDLSIAFSTIERNPCVAKSIPSRISKNTNVLHDENIIFQIIYNKQIIFEYNETCSGVRTLATCMSLILINRFHILP